MKDSETIITGNPKQSTAYNCHSDAWHGGKGDPSDQRNNNPAVPPNWDNSPSDDMAAAKILAPWAGNKVGDIVVYGNDTNNNGKLDAGNNEIQHSATVVEVDKKGNTTYVRSKEGQGRITFHHPAKALKSYGQKRVYYRKK